MSINEFSGLHPLIDGLRDAAGIMEEIPVVWLLDYTNAKICKLPEDEEALKSPQNDGRFRACYALIVGMEDVQASRAYLRQVRHPTAGARAVFGADARREAYAWASAQARTLRGTGAISTIAGLL